jgi:hypothetical protein
MEKARPLPSEVIEDQSLQPPPQWWDMERPFPGIAGEAQSHQARNAAREVYQRMKWVIGMDRDRPVLPSHIQIIFCKTVEQEQLKYSGLDLTLDHIRAVADRELTNGFRDDERNDEIRDYRIAIKTRELLGEAIADVLRMTET